MEFWNFSFWDVIIQFSVLCVILVLSNIIRKIKFIEKSLIPTAVIAGIIGLILRSCGLLNFMNTNLLEMIVYHAMCIGFIALALKQKYGKEAIVEKRYRSDGVNAGAAIAGTYALQGMVGLGLSMLLCLIFPALKSFAGALLPMGFGQGPGQSNNFGNIFETTGGFVGGQSFALSIASIGFLVGCIVSVIYLNILKRKGKFTLPDASKIKSDEEVENPENEMPLTEPIDKLSMNIGIVMLIFLINFGFMWGFKAILELGWFGNFGVKTILPMLFGFNFIFGTLFALLFKSFFKFLRKKKIAKHEYTSNSMLNRISGCVFDFMILASIVLIDIKALPKLILPLIIICLIGTIVTFAYLNWISKKLYKDYSLETFVSLFGNLTGTVSTGIAMLRVVDPEFKTKASGNLVLGSTYAIPLAAPVLFVMPLAITTPWLALVIFSVLFIMLTMFMFRKQLQFRKRISRVNAKRAALSDKTNIDENTIELNNNGAIIEMADVFDDKFSNIDYNKTEDKSE